MAGNVAGQIAGAGAKGFGTQETRRTEGANLRKNALQTGNFLSSQQTFKIAASDGMIDINEEIAINAAKIRDRNIIKEVREKHPEVYKALQNEKTHPLEPKQSLLKKCAQYLYENHRSRFKRITNDAFSEANLPLAYKILHGFNRGGGLNFEGIDI